MLKIGSLKLENPLALAPMAGATDHPFRLITREMGAALVVTEMVSAKGLIYNNKQTEELLYFTEAERPIAIQLFGSEPEVMAEAARRVAILQPDLVDINMGCPTPKIVKNGDGAALMRDPSLAARVVEAVVDAVGCRGGLPVTVKMRKGWDENSPTAADIARCVVAAGAQAVTVHGRTREQFYDGKADWDCIAAVKEAVDVPVWGNGDVDSPQAARSLLDKTGCDGVMIGRAALGNPWIFRRILHYLQTGELLQEPSAREKIKMAIRHLEAAVDYKGERVAIRQMRKHIGWYLKGLPHAAAVKRQMNQTETLPAARQLLQEFLSRCEDSQEAGREFLT